MASENLTQHLSQGERARGRLALIVIPVLDAAAVRIVVRALAVSQPDVSGSVVVVEHPEAVVPRGGHARHPAPVRSDASSRIACPGCGVHPDPDAL